MAERQRPDQNVINTFSERRLSQLAEQRSQDEVRLPERKPKFPRLRGVLQSVNKFRKIYNAHHD